MFIFCSLSLSLFFCCLDVKTAKQGSGKDGAAGGVGGAESGNFRERSPLRRRDSFEMPPMRGREPDGPTAMGRDMMMRGGPHRDMMGGRDFDSRPPERDWASRDHQRDLDPYPLEPPYSMERDRPDMHRPRDSFPPLMPDHRSGFAGPPGPQGPVANEVEIGTDEKSPG